MIAICARLLSLNVAKNHVMLMILRRYWERGIKKMTNLEMLRKCTPEQIRAAFCEEYCRDCEVCPSFLSDRCKYGKNGVLEWLNDEVNTPKDAQSDAPKGWIKHPF
jgi:hypothetical protein